MKFLVCAVFPTALINSSRSSAIFVLSVILLCFLYKDIEVVADWSCMMIRMKRRKTYLLISPVEKQSFRA